MKSNQIGTQKARDMKGLSKKEIAVQRGIRARQARVQTGMTQSAAAKKLNVSVTTISKIESGDFVDTYLIIPMARLYGVLPEWLYDGDQINAVRIIRGNHYTDIVSPNDHEIASSYVPLMGWDNAHLENLRRQAKNNEKVKWVPCLQKGGLDTFALIIEGDSMISPTPSYESFLPEDMIYIDPDVTPYDNSIVLIKPYNEDNCILRQYHRDAGSYWLRPLNPVFKATPLKDAIHIVGVCIGKIRIYEPKDQPAISRNTIKKVKVN